MASLSHSNTFLSPRMCACALFTAHTLLRARRWMIASKFGSGVKEVQGDTDGSGTGALSGPCRPRALWAAAASRRASWALPAASPWPQPRPWPWQPRPQSEPRSHSLPRLRPRPPRSTPVLRSVRHLRRRAGARRASRSRSTCTPVARRGSPRSAPSCDDDHGGDVA